MINFKSVRTKVVLGVSLVITIIFVILLTMNFLLSKKTFEKQARNDMFAITRQASEKIAAEIESAEKIVESFATNAMLYDNRFSDDVVLDFFDQVKKEDNFEAFFKIDKNGHAVNLNNKMAAFEAADEDYFKKAMNKETSVTSAVDKTTGNRVIIISTPYYNWYTGEFLGVFAGVKSTDFISKLCKGFKWGKTGNLAVYTTDSSVVGHTDQSVMKDKVNLLEFAASKPEYKTLGKFFNTYSKTNGVGEYTFRGAKRTGAIYNIENTDFVTLLAIDKNELMSGINTLEMKLIAVGLVLLAIMLILTDKVLGRQIAGAYNLLMTDIENLANYDLSKALVSNFSERRDEIGRINRSIIALKENMIRIVSDITAHSQNTAAMAEQLTATAQSTSESAHEVAVAVNNIADGASSQAQDTHSAKSSVEKSNELLNKMFEILKELSCSTDIIHSRKNEGNDLLSELVEITAENNDVSEKVSGVISETNIATEKISKASEMIQAISDQTNLLALNAAIEAARAGELGKGFAVVAEEIRKLAEESAGFTKEIREVIDELKNKSEKAVEMMKSSIKMSKKQTEKVSETGKKFEEISNAVESSRDIVNTMNKTSKYLQDENSNVIQIVANLSAIAEENAATTEQASASVDTQTQSIADISKASENLADIATVLQSEVSKFVLQ